MTRRGLFATFAAGLSLDPERLLWVPGKKLISIPAFTPKQYGIGYTVTRRDVDQYALISWTSRNIQPTMSFGELVYKRRRVQSAT